MATSSWKSTTAMECDAEPYMLSLFVADDSIMDAERMTPVLDPHKLEARLRAATSDLEALHERGEKKKGKKDPSSGPPSPPSSDGSTTPRVTIAACPPRLKPYSPPVNYGTVEVGQIYRSGFPHDRNMDFCRGLEIRSMLTLVDTPPSDAYTSWIASTSIKHLTIPLATNKDGLVNTTTASLCRALLFVMDSTNYPLHIHCNQGKHRTGCLVACLRKVQGVPLDQVLREYVAYSSPKQRDGDIKLITDFDPEVVYAYAKENGYLDGSLERNDSTIADVTSLAAAMAAGAAVVGPEDAGTVVWSSMSGSSMTSDTSLGSDEDEELVMISSAPSSKLRATDTATVSMASADEDDIHARAPDGMVGQEDTLPPTTISTSAALPEAGDTDPRTEIDPRLRIEA